ncbi:MAG: glycosyltransferase family 2 protein [Candidatus Moraniibacteriota bacterium]
MSSPKLSIAVNSYRTPELLRLCLQSLRDHVSGIDYEVISVDSATEEATEMMVREEFPEVRFFPYEQNVGFKTLVNRSIKESHGEYIFLINSDIIVNGDTVRELMRHLDTHAEVALAGPRQINFNGEDQLSCFRFYRPLTILCRRTILGRFPWGKRHLDWFLMKDYDRKSPRAVDWIMGSAMFVRREAALSVGLMDNRFFMYMEDVDWCRRFWEHGYQVCYIPQASVFHYHAKGSARGGLFGLLCNRLTWWHIASAFKYFWKYRGKEIPIHA